MALVKHFTGTTFATRTAEAFYGDGSFDTVSYALAPSAGSIGHYDVGVTIDLANLFLNTGLAAGDSYSGVERIAGSQYTDYMFGNAQANYFDGGGSPDFIYGRDGNDILRGGGGFDFLYGEGGNDVMNGQQQTDTMYGGNGADKMWGGSNFAVRVYPGTNYADVLYGGDGNDQLHGDAQLPADPNIRTEYEPSLDLMPARDELHGGSGDDFLNGDGGNDKLWGDSGADTFGFDAPYTVKDAAGVDLRITSDDDIVYGFNPVEDKLEIYSQTIVSQGLNVDGYLVLELSGGGSITLDRISVALADPSWFV